MALKNMLEDRITFYKTGANPPRKNIDLMLDLYPSGSSADVPVQDSAELLVNEEKSSSHKREHRKEHKKDDKKSTERMIRRMIRRRIRGAGQRTERRSVMQSK